MFVFECVGAAKYATTADDYAASNFSVFTASVLTFAPSISIPTVVKLTEWLHKPSISLCMDLAWKCR